MNKKYELCLGMAYYLNSYRPLIWTRFGQQAASNHQLPHFLDASCRREPDFENPFPSMTAICRGSQGAVRLREGDFVAYATVKRNYEPAATSGRYLIGGFEAIKRCATHEDAADWYRAQKVAIPSNCFVAGNPPLAFDLTGGYSDSREYVKDLWERDQDPEGIKAFNYAQRIQAWDAGYRAIIDGSADKKGNGTFIITKPIKLELVAPPLLTEATATQIFGDKFPNTRSLQPIRKEQFEQLMQLLPPLSAGL